MNTVWLVSNVPSCPSCLTLMTRQQTERSLGFSCSHPPPCQPDPSSTVQPPGNAETGPPANGRRHRRVPPWRDRPAAQAFRYSSMRPSRTAPPSPLARRLDFEDADTKRVMDRFAPILPDLHSRPNHQNPPSIYRQSSRNHRGRRHPSRDRPAPPCRPRGKGGLRLFDSLRLFLDFQSPTVLAEP